MKCMYSILLGSVMLLSACSKDRITGSGTIATETRNTTAFNSVSVSGSNNVYITKGTSLKVEVNGYANLLPYFETNVINNELRLGFRSNTNIRNDNIKVYLTMPDEIGFLNVQGSGNISTAGNFTNVNSIDLLINGSGNIDFEQGTAPKATLIVTGSGNVNALGLSAKEVAATINGSGNTRVTTTEKLDAAITGSGNIYYKGSPATVNTTIAGSGKVIKL